MDKNNQYLKNNNLNIEIKKNKIKTPNGNIRLTEDHFEYFKDNLINLIESFKKEHSMEDEYRLKRAEEQGFKTDKIYYHITNCDFEKFDTNKSADSKIWLTENKEQAYSGNDLGASGSLFVKELFIRNGKMAGWNEEDKYVSDQLIRDGFIGAKLDDVTYLFNPSDIRDTKASFNKENKSSVNIKDIPKIGITDFNILTLIIEKREELLLNSFVFNKKSKYKSGDQAYNESGDYMGIYLNSLSDFGIPDIEKENNFKKTLLEAGAFEIAKNKNNENNRFELYGVRKAYTEKTGSVNQFLIKDVTNGLSWINADKNNYTFTKTKKRLKDKIKKNKL